MNMVGLKPGFQLERGIDINVPMYMYSVSSICFSGLLLQ